MTDRRPPVVSLAPPLLDLRLAEEEDAWCARRQEEDAVRLVHRRLRERSPVRSACDDPLAADEDAWARR